MIDDPSSIVKCSNKIFMEQLMDELDIPRPKTWIYSSKSFQKSLKDIVFPCVLKMPDSAFSQGVYKANDEVELKKLAEKIFQNSELLLIQEYLPTDYDWRIGVLGNEVLFACKYYMAKNHWQIIKKNDDASFDMGNFECIHPKDVDKKIIQAALKLTKSIGDGLYGVDIKQVGKKIYVIEVNDNPNVDDGVEDLLLGDLLYEKIMGHFLNKCNQLRMINSD